MKKENESIVLATVCFSFEIERKKGRFMVVNVTDKWY
jgi:hypothetical protein